METAKCYVCGASDVELRIDNQDTANGPLWERVCQSCYAKDSAERRAEAKRFGYRPRVVPWAKLISSDQGRTP